MRSIAVDELYQQGYKYILNEPLGRNFNPIFNPDLSPGQMLKLGIFGGNYFTEAPKEFPSAWFESINLSEDEKANPSLNYFGVNASMGLKDWQRKGWIYEEDPKGWFLWYCRYYLGRRIPDEDNRQIKRWLNMRRHVTQVKKNCQVGNENCHKKQRQALLHWAYDSRII